MGTPLPVAGTDPMTSALHILTLSCQEQPGIVGAAGMFLAGHHCNILESGQFGDTEENRFMMRVSFERLATAPDDLALAAAFDAIGRRPRVLLMVSKFDHRFPG